MTKKCFGRFCSKLSPAWKIPLLQFWPTAPRGHFVSSNPLLDLCPISIVFQFLCNSEHWCWVGREISRVINCRSGVLIRYQWHCLFCYDNTPYRQLCVCVTSILIHSGSICYRHRALQSGQHHRFLCSNCVFRSTASRPPTKKNYPLSRWPNSTHCVVHVTCSEFVHVRNSTPKFSRIYSCHSGYYNSLFDRIIRFAHKFPDLRSSYVLEGSAQVRIKCACW